ncbi:uncharacterized protein LOC130798249 [Amaranthus tricolor]|uniref:uncharacterized protein LOC130798249 n=1 Tax=Amaranthus tricolor TaxID=29722 RepID=UPI00258E4CFC|nr:uncharacterized protein LOC130798249 [Amaranthus tricolor]
MKLIQFLSGINPAYDQVKTNILSTDPLPNINKVYHILQSVERQHQNNLYTSHSNDISAFAAHQLKPDNSAGMRKDSKKTKFERVCEHCKGKGHTIDQCFKLIGYPEWYTNKKGKSVSRTAANVQVDNSGILGSIPCSSSSGKMSSPVIDPQMLFVVCKEVIKCMNQSSISTDPLTSSYTNVNSAGPYN